MTDRSGAASRVILSIGRAGALWPVLLVALAFLGIALTSEQAMLRQIGLVAGLTLVAVVLGTALLRAQGSAALRARVATLAALVENDAAPCLVCDDKGQALHLNPAARRRFPNGQEIGMIAALKEFSAAPLSVLHRLQKRAEQTGAAHEDVITRTGHIRISVTDLGRPGFLWRLEEFADKSAQARGPDGFGLPMLIANRAGVVLFSNEALRRRIGLRPRRLDQVFQDGPLVSGEEVVLRAAAGPVRALLAEIEGVGERREMFLLPVPESRRSPDEEPLEHVPVAMARFAADGTLLTANAEARRLLSLVPGQEAMFHAFFEGLGRPVTDWLADVVSARAPARSEVLTHRDQAEQRFLRVSLHREVLRGRPCALATIQDATAITQLETQINQSQKMQAIGQLAGGIAHDFNNLLTAISGHCDLLLLRHSIADGDYGDLQQIRQNTNRAAALVAQLLAFSRKQVLTPDDLEIGESLVDLTHLLNRLLGERFHLRIEGGEEELFIRVDRRQLEQVIINIVVNARDAMPGGGMIRLGTRKHVIRTAETRGRAVIPPGSYAVIEIADTGTGIPADRIEKIFEPFYTTKKPGEGTGLGLAMVYGIVKQSGGFIFVRSQEGAGTTFELIFPLREAPEQLTPDTAPDAEAKGPKPLRGGTILLVEDEAPVRTFASRALRLRGLTVIEAANAEEALSRLEDPALHVDLFVTDVVMPGMDGPSWVRQALERRPGVGVVFVSGYAEDALSEEQARIPNSTFLAKPFSLSDLALTVQNQLAIH